MIGLFAVGVHLHSGGRTPKSGLLQICVRFWMEHISLRSEVTKTETCMKFCFSSEADQGQKQACIMSILGGGGSQLILCVAGRE